MTTRDPTAPVSPEIERQVAEIMARPYRKVITGDATDGFLATVPDLPGCVTAGETAEEALALLHDAMEGWLISVLERDVPVPEPSGAGQYSGKVLVRMPRSLHRRLMERAEEEGVSANQLAVAILTEGLAVREHAGVSGRRPSADEGFIVEVGPRLIEIVRKYQALQDEERQPEQTTADLTRELIN